MACQKIHPPQSTYWIDKDKEVVELWLWWDLVDHIFRFENYTSQLWGYICIRDSNKDKSGLECLSEILMVALGKV